MKNIKKRIFRSSAACVTGFVLLFSLSSNAADQASTMAALRMDNTILGGLLPTSDPNFAAMANAIQGGDYLGAANIAIGTPYFAKYLGRRMAKQMQNPTLSSAGVPDNDASTFILAHFLNGSSSNVQNQGISAGISKIWSDNLTCQVNVAGTPTSASKLTAAQIDAVNWQNSIVCNPGQQDAQTTPVAINAADVGGYMTLSSQAGDGSYAQNAFTAGTNLRGIEYFYEISMGLGLTQMIVQDGATAQAAPAFIPQGDPNFFIGKGQPSCISCHASGVSNIYHGYATFADKFEFDPTNGFVYNAAPTTSTMKSYGSNSGTRTQVANCIKNRSFPSGFTACNPDSLGVSASQAWDLTTWKNGGLLAQMGWTGPITGNGLNSLGSALGKAGLVYQFLVQRVIGEICPTGTVSSDRIAAIASAAQASDSFASIVASVAAEPVCRQ